MTAPASVSSQNLDSSLEEPLAARSDSTYKPLCRVDRSKPIPEDATVERHRSPFVDLAEECTAIPTLFGY